MPLYLYHLEQFLPLFPVLISTQLLKTRWINNTSSTCIISFIYFILYLLFGYFFQLLQFFLVFVHDTLQDLNKVLLNEYIYSYWNILKVNCGYCVNS